MGRQGLHQCECEKWASVLNEYVLLAF